MFKSCRINSTNYLSMDIYHFLKVFLELGVNLNGFTGFSHWLGHSSCYSCLTIILSLQIVYAMYKLLWVTKNYVVNVFELFIIFFHRQKIGFIATLRWTKQVKTTRRISFYCGLQDLQLFHVIFLGLEIYSYNDVL